MTMTTDPPLDLTFPAADGLPLRGRYWARGAGEPRGLLVVAHGFGEHGGCYDEAARRLNAGAGVDVFAPDFRGHGRSPGRRGVVRHYDELVTDLAAALDYAGRRVPGKPRFLLGHSNGGQVALRVALDPEAGPTLAGLVLSNPVFRLALRVPPRLIRVGRFLQRYAPGVTLKARVRPGSLTHDPLKALERRADALGHGRINAPFFFGMVEGGRHVADHIHEVRTPTLLLVGGADPVVDPATTRDAFDRLGSPDKTLKDYPDMLHEPLNELDRDLVYRDLIGWLDHRLPPDPGGAATAVGSGEVGSTAGHANEAG